MKVTDFPRAIRSHWRLVVAGVLLGVLVATGVALLMPVKYSARVSMYVSTPATPGPASSDLEGAQLAQNRIKSYLVLVTSDRVLGDVSKRLNLNETPTQLSQYVTPSSPLDSVIIDVDVFDPSPERAARVANGIGDVFPGVVASIEPRATPDGPPAVQVGVIEPAAVPSDPVSLTIPVLAALGLLGGLVLGVGAAVGATLLDRTVRSEHLLRAITGVPVLASIPRDPAAPMVPLVVRDDPYAPRAEAFRQLRTALRIPDVDGRRKVVVVTSPNGGQGSTTTIANLAVAAAALGSRVLVVDANLRRPRAAEILGGTDTPGLSEVLSGRALLDRAIQRRPGGTGLDLLAAGSASRNPGEIVGSLNMAALLRSLRGRYDLILVDAPPVLPVTDTVALAPFTDGVVLQCGYGNVPAPDVEVAVDSLRAAPVAVLGSVLSMTPRDLGPRRDYGAVGDDAIPGSVVEQPAPLPQQAVVPAQTGASGRAAAPGSSVVAPGPSSAPAQSVGPVHGPVPPPQPSGEQAAPSSPGPNGTSSPPNLDPPTVQQQPVNATRGSDSNKRPRPGPKPTS